jgi:hypothetical protein
MESFVAVDLFCSSSIFLHMERGDPVSTGNFFSLRCLILRLSAAASHQVPFHPNHQLPLR